MVAFAAALAEMLTVLCPSAVPKDISNTLAVLLPFLILVFLVLVRVLHGVLLLELQVIHGGYCRGAGRDAIEIEPPERRQRTAVERGGEGGAAGVGDLGVVELERLELRQPSGRRRRLQLRRRCRLGG